MKFAPNFLLRDAMGWLLALGLLGGAVRSPLGAGAESRPFASAPVGSIKPEW
jgi:hypothetical protein